MRSRVLWLTVGAIVLLASSRVMAQPPQRPAGPPRLPDDIRVEADIPYADTDNPRQRVDMVLPKKPAGDKPLPLVVFIHGGGWQGGDRKSGAGQVASLVASGDYVGATVGYRLSGEAVWPAQIHDCKAAIRWLRANAKKYNFDPDRIGIWGSSAGGHLVAMLGVSGDVKELEGTLGKHTDQSSRVACVVDYFGPADLLLGSKSQSAIDPRASQTPVARLLGGPVQENKDKAREASPITHVSKGDAPILIVHGTNDSTVPINQSENFHEALKKAGVNSTLVKVVGAGHGFRSPEVKQRVQAFFDKQLRGQDVKVSDEPIEESPPR